MSSEEGHKPIATNILARGVADSQHVIRMSEEFGGAVEEAETSGGGGGVADESAGTGTAPLSASHLSTGRTVVVDPKTAIDSEERSPISERVNVSDLVRVIRRDDRFSEVTVEQVERVRYMHEKINDGAVFSFNYNTLLLVASAIAALGLASDNSTTIIASMLVSPIMGPVVAIAYGTTICDKKMVKLAVWNELVSLIVCIAVGVVIGAICGSTALGNDFPTQEMYNRATISSLLVGIPVAFFSGLGVAVGLLDDNTNSLVGVAISASLLPPAVNSGMIWVSYGLYVHDSLGTVEELEWDDFRQAGSMSLALTLANIVMIWISSMLMFRLKEVLPMEKKVFWSDLGIARKIYTGKAILMPGDESTSRDPIQSGATAGDNVG